MSIAEPLFHKSRHFISCYDDEKNGIYALQNLRKIARYFVSQGYGVVYGAEEFQENDVHAQELLAKRIMNAKELSTSSNQLPNTKESVQGFRKYLLLINPESIRYKTHSSLEIVDNWISEYSRAAKVFAKENLKPRRIIGISNPYPFYENGEFDKFAGFEQRIEKAFGDKLALICWYKKKWLEKMTLPQLLKILNTHGSVIYDDLDTNTFDSRRIINIITETIDAIAIEDDKRNDNSIVSTLLLGTIRHAYHIDEKSLVLEPDKLEHVLTKMLGKQSYEELEQKIMTKLIKKIFGFSDSKLSTEKRNVNNVSKS